jgi:hypothetical protein
MLFDRPKQVIWQLCLQEVSRFGRGDLRRRAAAARIDGSYWGKAMAKTRRYSIEVRDAKSKTIVISTVVDWTSDEKQIAVAHIFRLPGVAGANGLTHRLSQRRSAARAASVAPKKPIKRHT